MSKSLNAKIVAEIERRETARIKEEMEKEKARNDNTKVTIMSFLNTEFGNCLADFHDFSSYEINDFAANYNHKFRQNAEELGFKFEIKEKDRHSSYDRYVLTIPEFKKGSRRTPAQLMLYKFERELSKKRRERKVQLITECKRIKQEINAGNYKYNINWNGKLINVETDETFNTEFEKDIIKSFFLRYGLVFMPDYKKITLKVKEEK